MLKECKRLEKEIGTLDKMIKKMPEGRLVCTVNGNRYKWYNSKPKHLEYIPKKNRDLAELLAEKKYLSLRKDELVKEKTAIKFYLRHSVKDEYRSKELLVRPGYKDLLEPRYKELADELKNWMNEEYATNNSHPENLKHNIGNGRRVRSKSEMMIAHELIAHKIPFRYECALELTGGIFYPDFTIKKSRTGEVVYWEHLGLMEKTDYRELALAKIRRFAENGIFPGEHLILTYETSNSPLSYEMINAMIDLYLL